MTCLQITHCKLVVAVYLSLMVLTLRVGSSSALTLMIPESAKEKINPSVFNKKKNQSHSNYIIKANSNSLTATTTARLQNWK